MNTVSIIIPTYNRAQYISLTIESFLNQTYDADKVELLVCDNHSTDHTKEVIEGLIRKYPERNIRYLYEDRQGVHYTRNTAAKQAAGEILYFTDDDMVAAPDLLEKLLAVFELNEKIAVATGKVIPRWEVTPPKWVEKYLNNRYLSLNDRNAKLLVTDYDCGVYSCHEAVRREVFFQTCGFHPENTAGLWIGDGETGLNREIVQMGCWFAYVGDSVIEHITPPGRMTQKYLNKRLYNQGNSDMYSEYKAKKGAVSIHWYNRLPKLLHKWLQITYQSLRKKNTMRFCISYVSYYKAQIHFMKELRRNETFRQLVERDDWLRDEHR